MRYLVLILAFSACGTSSFQEIRRSRETLKIIRDGTSYYTDCMFVCMDTQRTREQCSLACAGEQVREEESW